MVQIYFFLSFHIDYVLLQVTLASQVEMNLNFMRGHCRVVTSQFLFSTERGDNATQLHCSTYGPLVRLVLIHQNLQLHIFVQFSFNSFAAPMIKFELEIIGCAYSRILTNPDQSYNLLTAFLTFFEAKM